MLTRLKRMILSLCRYSGALELVAGSSWRRSRLLILGYHGISQADEHEWNGRLYMPPDQFRARLLLLRQGDYTVLSLDDAVRRLYENRLPPRAVAITFDDGYVDFYRKAYPILQEFAFPATVYLTTYYAELSRPVFDVMCSYLLWKGRGQIVDGAGVTDTDAVLDLRSEASRLAAARAVRRAAKQNRLDALQKDAIAAEIANRVGVDYPALLDARLLQLMRPEEVRALSPELIDVQLHTHRHRTPRERSEFSAEIVDNRGRLATLTASERVRGHFCYPSGDYDMMFLPWLRELGVVSATTVDPGLASTRTDPLLLPRLMDSCSNSPVVFEAWASGVANWLARHRHPAIEV
ncbi:MAG TPA: polysaccharide deacetylase family protein [Gemmatimonadaceae bacterium]|jgi:peptidoglycan/xylan/chitin deacetylase (PgdA/CDA1 family)|nr:polysaccharide deacetylase family protein [Gemmatimonadaceae bacterium]